MATITSVTLTRNEAANISSCILSFKNIVERIIVMDNFSDDGTKEIAESLGAEVFQSELGYKERFKLGTSELTQITSDWILFLDADERITPEAAAELKELCDRYASDPQVNGIVVRYRTCFLGKELMHGGFYPLKKLRVFKPGTFYMENLELDEHILLKNGKYVEMKNDFLHMDFKGLSHWVVKHNGYALRAAKDYFSKFNQGQIVVTDGLEKTAKMKRLIKYKIYYKLPIGMRAYLFYLYCYYVRLGFLDGKEGKIYAFLHSYWYRFLVDSYIYEMNKEKNNKGEGI